ncbi:MAG: SPOR domain-containing protein [Muribaculaceae bacterium]|nr:SPOR domain-containing protein [Muribaculaceae bacterium]
MRIHTTLVRLLCATIIAMVALAGYGQKPDIVTHITKNGQVTITAPQELTLRSNETAKSKAESGDNDEDDADKEKDKKTDESKTVKRTHTNQQTLQARGVGYRIQAYSNNDSRTGKTAVQQRARAIAMRFPQYRSYISYNAPAWKLRIGDFKSQADAQAALSRIRSVFPQYARDMSVVRDKVNVWSHD